MHDRSFTIFLKEIHLDFGTFEFGYNVQNFAILAEKNFWFFLVF